jgi:hypothetical protein
LAGHAEARIMLGSMCAGGARDTERSSGSLYVACLGRIAGRLPSECETR